jgi:AcrR family transcriptional regulator
MEAIGRRQVMGAVIHILSANGRRDLTMREVSDLAGIPCGAITHYFSNRRALTLDAGRWTRSTMPRCSSSRHPANWKADAPTTRRIVSQPSPSGIPEWRFWLTFFGWMPFDGVAQAEVQKVQRLYAEVIVRLVEAGVDEGSLHPSRKPGDFAIKFISTAFGLCVPMLAEPPKAMRCRRPLLDLLSQDLGVTLGDSPSAEANTSAVN